MHFSGAPPGATAAGTEPAAVGVDLGSGYTRIWASGRPTLHVPTVSDSLTVAPDFKVTVSDASGNLVIILDGNIPFARGNFRPGRSINVKGVLVPDGVGSWTLKPREVGDVVFNN